MTDTGAVCPYCGNAISRDATVCPSCQEDLSSLVRLEYEHAILYNEALALAREERYGEAHAKLVAALHLQDAFVPAHVLLAKVQVRQSDLEKAQASIATAMELAPEDASIRATAAEIARMASEAAQESQSQARAAERAKKARVERYWATYKRDLGRSFALGAAVVGVLALLFGRRGAGDGDA